MLNTGQRCAPARGFTLLEILVSMVVFSLAFLALALLLSRSLAMTHNASIQSVVRLQAIDLAERIHSNHWVDRNPDSAKFVGGSIQRSATGMVSVGTNLCSTNSNALDCRSANCSPEELKTWDIAQWCARTQALLKTSFVGAAVEFRPGGTTKAAYVIVIEWLERDIGFGAAGADTIPNSIEYEVSTWGW